MQLQLKTWPFVEDYLKTKTGIIIPIGSTEQHGPTGQIGTDALTAEMVGRGVGEKVGALVFLQGSRGALAPTPYAISFSSEICAAGRMRSTR